MLKPKKTNQEAPNASSGAAERIPGSDFRKDASEKVNPLSYGSAPRSAMPFGAPPKRAVGRFFVSIVLIVVFGFLASTFFSSGFLFRSGFPPVSGDRWQAVFFSNGQVYFGHLREVTREYAELRDIFYLRAATPLQQGSEAASELSLVKLGAELHGPEDVMYVPKDTITFWENLREDSRVVQAIANFLRSQSGN